MKTINEILSMGPVIPVLTIHDLEQGEAICRALYAGGIKTLEITLRTDAAMQMIRRATRIADDLVVGAGTITRPEQCEMAKQAGAQFGVSPGFTAPLAAAAASAQLPWLPGVMTPTELMTALDAGYQTVKFFPTLPAGGASMLNNLRGPFPNVKFCPTGGITAQNAPDFLALPNVICVGGSWLTPHSALVKQDWDEITRLARLAVSALK